MSARPWMKPCRPEMRAEACHGANDLEERIATLGKAVCGRTVELACSRCGCHRCSLCAVAGAFCPACLLTDPRKFDAPRGEA